MRAGGEGLLGFNVRIGVHVGEVIQGVVGWKKKAFAMKRSHGMRTKVHTPSSETLAR